jgi:metal-responsive CopG/Arc/MetJ family transcriptional regulator
MWATLAIEIAMKTVQMTLDDELVRAVNRAVKKLGTTRSAFTRDALRAALRQLEVRERERRDRAGYAARPVRKGEFDWENGPDWGD